MSVRDQVRRTVGRYEIVREVGRGATAVVYLARQTDLDRDVALKELAAFRAGDPDLLERFLRESRLAGSLSHPNIVTVFEYFPSDGTAFIAMEYFERGSLRPYVGRLDVGQVGGVLEGLLAGLAHAERRGIVHRDLKPENVMVTGEGGVKIADFGIAKAVGGSDGRSLTGSGAAVGTPAYMAPELVTDGEIGPWTDLYALGVMAYELLAGRPPFHETEHGLALMLLHAKEPVPPLASVMPDLDSELAAWVDALLAKQPRERPSGAAAAAERLDEILLAALGPRWRRAARLEPIAGVASSTDNGATPATGASPTRGDGARRRRIAAISIGGAGVVLAAAVALALSTRSDPSPSVAPPARVVADLIPNTAERFAAAAAGPTVAIADPSGRVVRLAGETLRVDASSPDPARPRAAVLAGGTLLVADDESLTALDPDSLASLGATRLSAGRPLLASSGGLVAIALTRGRSAGRVCLVTAGPRLAPCLDLPFAPTGLGVAPSGRLDVADGRTGIVRSYRRASDRLVSVGGPFRVGRAPHGRLAAHRGLLYVPVTRGVAVVDPVMRAVRRTLTLPVTPSDVWISPSTGRLFAPLPGVGTVAVLGTGSAEVVPRLVAVAGKPVAVAGTAAASAPVVVVGIDGTVTRLDARSGRRIDARRIGALGLPSPAPLVLRRVGSDRSGDALSLVLELTGGHLDETSLVVRDGTLSDGRAAFEIWQGGIRSRVRSRTVDGVTVRVAPGAGHLRVTLSAARGAYERLRIGREGPRTVAATMRRVATPATSGVGTSDRGSGTPTTPRTGGGTTTPPPSSPKGPYDIG